MKNEVLHLCLGFSLPFTKHTQISQCSLLTFILQLLSVLKNLPESLENKKEQPKEGVTFGRCAFCFFNNATLFFLLLFRYLF